MPPKFQFLGGREVGGEETTQLKTAHGSWPPQHTLKSIDRTVAMTFIFSVLAYGQRT